tara:strand:+ start:79940 stop:80056 length:117 start_codon:yes stop_codon:yes gene_type:complete
MTLSDAIIKSIIYFCGAITDAIALKKEESPDTKEQHSG